MKRYLIAFSITILMCLVIPITVKAEISLSNIYISVTDAKTALQDKDTKAFEAHFKDIKENWSKVNKKRS